MEDTMDNFIKHTEFSKTLSKEDEGAARLIKNLLSGRPGFGIDLEIIFETKSEGYTIIEFLKCESTYVTPFSSHPHRYWDKNWRKFVFLWHITKKLEGQLYLVNYEERSLNNYGLFKVMKVDMSKQPSEKVMINITEEIKINEFSTFQKWYLKINDNPKGGELE